MNAFRVILQITAIIMRNDLKPGNGPIYLRSLEHVFKRK